MRRCGPLAIVIASFLLACGADGAGDDQGMIDAGRPARMEANVSVIAGFLDPATVRVQRGGTVTWRNDDGVTHRLVSGDVGAQDVGAVFDSIEVLGGAFVPSEMFSVTFSSPGTIRYHCPDHASVLHGTVIVE